MGEKEAHGSDDLSCDGRQFHYVCTSGQYVSYDDFHWKIKKSLILMSQIMAQFFKNLI